ncbi:hypothetical protein SAMN06295949_13431 [Pseudomonas delhiensis]|uniref:Uncharacterized protein n=1 Tax=Pseudomonas delhiensis TaxID=366289 RepID=A0ABY1T200_9PSED|nr:hypothetical protein SAMN06295949_13431 [Pseudomonas delhiensis]
MEEGNRREWPPPKRRRCNMLWRGRRRPWASGSRAPLPNPLPQAGEGAVLRRRKVRRHPHTPHSTVGRITVRGYPPVAVLPGRSAWPVNPIADEVRSYAGRAMPFPCRSAPCARIAGRARSYDRASWNRADSVRDHPSLKTADNAVGVMRPTGSRESSARTGTPLQKAERNRRSGGHATWMSREPRWASQSDSPEGAKRETSTHSERRATPIPNPLVSRVRGNDDGEIGAQCPPRSCEKRNRLRIRFRA